MARDRGLLPISANFETKSANPFDARGRVELESDLYKPETWENFHYVGMTTSVYADTEAKNGLYLLKTLDFTKTENWEKIGSGGGGSANYENISGVSHIATSEDNGKVFINPTPFAGTSEYIVDSFIESLSEVRFSGSIKLIFTNYASIRFEDEFYIGSPIPLEIQLDSSYYYILYRNLDNGNNFSLIKLSHINQADKVNFKDMQGLNYSVKASDIGKSIINTGTFATLNLPSTANAGWNMTISAGSTGNVPKIELNVPSGSISYLSNPTGEIVSGTIALNSIENYQVSYSNEWHIRKLGTGAGGGSDNYVDILGTTHVATDEDNGKVFFSHSLPANYVIDKPFGQLNLSEVRFSGNIQLVLDSIDTIFFEELPDGFHTGSPITINLSSDNFYVLYRFQDNGNNFKLLKLSPSPQPQVRTLLVEDPSGENVLFMTDDGSEPTDTRP